MAAKMKIGSASIRAKGHDAIVRSREGRMRYAPTPVRSILVKLRSLGVKEDPNKKSLPPKTVGAYRIRPPWRRI